MNPNGHSEIRQSGHGPHLEVVTEGNPYTIRRRPERLGSDESPPKGVERDLEAVEDEGVTKELVEEAEPKRDRKRRHVFAVFLLMVIAGVVAFAYANRGGATKIDHQVKVNRPGGAILQAQGLQGETTDQQTEAAIAQAKESRRSADLNNPMANEDGASRVDSTIAAAPPGVPQLSIADEYADPAGGRIVSVDTAGDTVRDAGRDARGLGFTGADQSGAGHARNRTASQPRHGASSVYTIEAEETKASTVGVAAAPARFNQKISFNRKEKVIALPAFGAMLPVRTLGAVYTLRNSLTRLELARDIEGEGWALKKGTVLIAQQQGGAFDRAYVSVTGFIDPGANRLVKMTGEVLGIDGAPGLKGKRRQISSRWSRAFNRILNIAPGIAQAALARNGGTTVITPAGGVTSDLIGTGAFSFDRREFVEVEAGTAGYVMVTDLPDANKGVDADPEKYFAGGDQGSLSDEELAKLLFEGAPQQIKEAMPRMSPEMRRAAALAIGDPEK